MIGVSAGSAEVCAAIANARTVTDRLFACLDPAALLDRPIQERHRLLFYVGHLEAFDWNQIGRAGLGLSSFRPDFDKLFEFGIDPVVGSEPSDQAEDWPPMDEVRNYCLRTRAAVDAVVADAPQELLHIGLEHRLMHAETLAYLLHRLPLDRKHGPVPRAVDGRRAPVNPMLPVPAGEATLGLRRGDGFGWDNEFDAHKLHVPKFRISRYKVTNGEYLEFVRDGGPTPPFWRREAGEWRLVCIFGETPLPLDWPVYVTWEQAVAFASNRRLELPTEAQFHRAAYGTPGGGERAYPWGEETPESVDGNFDFRGWDPVPVDATPAGDSAFGAAQTVGNGWEWTSTVFGPFDGFRQFLTYPGYSANFFDGRHFVLKGGSARTAARLLRRSFRNWFRSDYPHVYAGFRLVENL